MKELATTVLLSLLMMIIQGCSKNTGDGIEEAGHGMNGDTEDALD